MPALMPVNLQSYGLREGSVGHSTGVIYYSSNTETESFTSSWASPEGSRWSLTKLLVQTQMHNKAVNIRGWTPYQSTGTAIVLLKVLLT